jgi:hypothetical protein
MSFPLRRAIAPPVRVDEHLCNAPYTGWGQAMAEVLSKPNGILPNRVHTIDQGTIQVKKHGCKYEGSLQKSNV